MMCPISSGIFPHLQHREWQQCPLHKISNTLAKVRQRDRGAAARDFWEPGKKPRVPGTGFVPGGIRKYPEAVRVWGKGRDLPSLSEGPVDVPAEHEPSGTVHPEAAREHRGADRLISQTRGGQKASTKNVSAKGQMGTEVQGICRSPTAVREKVHDKM